MRIALAVINLDRDRQRYTFMTSQLDAAGLGHTRFSAVLGFDVPGWLRPWFFTADGIPTPSLKPGEVGVYASHLCIHRQLLESDLDAMLVLEDDVEISPRLGAFLAVADRLPADFDIVRLSNPAKAPYIVRDHLTADSALVVYSRVPNNLGCYLISRSGAQKTLQPRGLRRWAIDEDMRRPWDWDLATYGVLPPPTVANVLETSSIDGLGSRPLGQETPWQKLRRRRWIGPRALARRIVWQVRFLGGRGWLACVLRAVMKPLVPRSARPGWLRIER